ncbi:MAG: hypothetical protein ABEL51_15680 [Salinibacter sp.]
MVAREALLPTVEMTELDETDYDILVRRYKRFKTLPGARTGDWLIMPSGRFQRVAHHWGDSVQPTDGDGSFHLQKGGTISHSGGLQLPIPIEQLVDTGRLKPAKVWFFHHDMWRARNGVTTTIPCRIFQVEGEVPEDREPEMQAPQSTPKEVQH